jgi:hypothetical protein
MNEAESGKTTRAAENDVARSRSHLLLCSKIVVRLVS